jgi:ParB family chromosome partitioning protein
MSKKTASRATGLGKGLGKGFGSLLPQDFDQSMLLDKHDRVQKVLLADIVPDPKQPRRHFDEQLINELAQSLRRYGILQPLVVTEQKGAAGTESGSKYYIVAGERRYRAAQKAGLDRIPVLVRTLEELERLEVSLVENVQRVDLNPIEQAVSVARLHEQFNIGYSEIAERLGKAHTTVINIVRLLQLPEFAREALRTGRISEGHARSVLALKNESLQKELIQNIEQKGWSVRAAEQFVSENRAPRPSDGEFGAGKATPASSKISQKLSKKWGFKVTVTEKVRGGGKVLMNFDTHEQLQQFIDFLEKTKH